MHADADCSARFLLLSLQGAHDGLNIVTASQLSWCAVMVL
jgi:hypothetical protein